MTAYASNFHDLSMVFGLAVGCWQTPAWLEQMIAHTTWRDLFYKLAEAHPDCLMLNFTVKVGRVLESRKMRKEGQLCSLPGRALHGGLFILYLSSVSLSKGSREFVSVLRSALTVSVLGTREFRLCACANAPQADLTYLPHQTPRPRRHSESGLVTTAGSVGEARGQDQCLLGSLTLTADWLTALKGGVPMCRALAFGLCGSSFLMRVTKGRSPVCPQPASS